MEDHSFQGEDSPPPEAGWWERACRRCGSTALGQVETVPLGPAGNIDLYLICEDCGADIGRVGPGGGVL